MRKWLDRRSLKTIAAGAVILFGIAAVSIYFNYGVQSLLWKSITAGAAILFSFPFLIVSNAALNKTSFAKKKASGFIFFLAFLFAIVIYFITSYLIGRSDVLLLLPLSGILLYWVYIRGNFIEIGQNDSEQVKLHIETLKRRFNQQTNFMLMSVFVLTVLPLFFFVGLLPIPATFGALYSVSLIIYAVIFSVVTAFGVLGLGRDEANSLNSALKRPLLGLAHMCVAFFMVALVGTVLGTDVDTSLFAAGTTLGKAFSLETLGVGVIRILLIESIIISFPFTIIYVYTILRTFLLGSTGESQGGY